MSEGGIGNPAARIVEASWSKVRTLWPPVSSASRCDAASSPRRPLDDRGGSREASTDDLWLLLTLANPPCTAGQALARGARASPGVSLRASTTLVSVAGALSAATVTNCTATASPGRTSATASSIRLVQPPFISASAVKVSGADTVRPSTLLRSIPTVSCSHVTNDWRVTCSRSTSSTSAHSCAASGCGAGLGTTDGCGVFGITDVSATGRGPL